MRGVSYQVRRIAVNVLDAAMESVSQHPRRFRLPPRCARILKPGTYGSLRPLPGKAAGYASFTQTCLMRVYSSIEYIDMSLP